jgi:hypothetical protein
VVAIGARRRGAGCRQVAIVRGGGGRSPVSGAAAGLVRVRLVGRFAESMRIAAAKTPDCQQYVVSGFAVGGVRLKADTNVFSAISIRATVAPRCAAGSSQNSTTRGCRSRAACTMPRCTPASPSVHDADLGKARRRRGLDTPRQPRETSRGAKG